MVQACLVHAYLPWCRTQDPGDAGLDRWERKAARLRPSYAELLPQGGFLVRPRRAPDPPIASDREDVRFLAACLVLAVIALVSLFIPAPPAP